jgi:hypothetical protein
MIEKKDDITARFITAVNDLVQSLKVRNRNEIVDKLGWDKTAMSNVMNGRRPVPYDIAEKLFTVYNIENNVNVSNVKPASLDNGKSNMFLVPLKAYGGFLSGYADTVFMDSLEKVSFPFIKGDCYAFEVEGFSGSPDYNPGDYIIATPVEKFEWLRKNQIYVFQTIDGLLLKVFDKIEGNFCHVHSINEDYNPVPPIPLKSLKKVYYKEYTIKK